MVNKNIENTYWHTHNTDDFCNCAWVCKLLANIMQLSKKVAKQNNVISSLSILYKH